MNRFLVRRARSLDTTICRVAICLLVSVAVLGGCHFACQIASGQVEAGPIVPIADPISVAPACPAPGITLDGEVVRVIDGDTVVVRSAVEYKVRLLDCWAPESRTRDLAEKQQGLKAKHRLEELATAKPVRVHLPAAGDLEEMLTLGRVLGRVWVLENKEPAPADLSSIMVSEHLAAKSRPVKASP